MNEIRSDLFTMLPLMAEAEPGAPAQAMPAMPQSVLEDETKVKAKHVRHGHTVGRKTTPEYRSYHAMMQRCYYKKGHKYPTYGARGITVCERWRNSFLAFVEDVGPRPSPEYTLDRWPNNDGNYEPGNVRWATLVEQANNTRQNRRIEHAGESLSIAQWAQRLGMEYGALQSRLDRNWPLDLAFDPGATRRGLAKEQKRERLVARRAAFTSVVFACAWCNAPFTRKTIRTKCCSQRCRKAFTKHAYYHLNIDRINADRRARAAQLRAK